MSQARKTFILLAAVSTVAIDFLSTFLPFLLDLNLLADNLLEIDECLFHPKVN